MDKLNLCLGVIGLERAGPYFSSVWTFSLWSSLNGEATRNLTPGQNALFGSRRIWPVINPL